MLNSDKKKPQLLTNRYFYRSHSQAPTSNRLFDRTFAFQNIESREDKTKPSLKITNKMKNGPSQREKGEWSLREDMSNHLLGQVKNKFKQIFKSKPLSQNIRLRQSALQSRKNISHQHQLSVSHESGVITSLNKGKDRIAQKKVSTRRYVKLNSQAQNVCQIKTYSNQSKKQNVIDMVYFLKKINQAQKDEKRQILDDEEGQQGQNRYLISRHTKRNQQKIKTEGICNRQEIMEETIVNYQSQFLYSPCKRQQSKPIKTFPIQSLNMKLSNYGQFVNKLQAYEHPFLLKHKSSYKRSRNQNKQHTRSKTNKISQIISIQ